MNHTHESLLEPGNDDFVEKNRIGVQDKLVMAQTLLKRSSDLLGLIQTKQVRDMSSQEIRAVWLVFTRGDLADRTDREAFMIDAAQRDQVFDYLEIAMGISFSPNEKQIPHVFDNIWRLYCVHDIYYRRFTHPVNFIKQEMLDDIWAQYDSVQNRGRDLLNTPEFKLAFEDCFYIRGLTIAKTDIQNIKKCLEPFARKTYNFSRGEERFQKLFRNHGRRPELVECYRQFQQLMTRYVPEYLVDTARRFAAVDESHPGRDKMIEILNNARKMIDHVRPWAAADNKSSVNQLDEALEVVESVKPVMNTAAD